MGRILQSNITECDMLFTESSCFYFLPLVLLIATLTNTEFKQVHASKASASLEWWLANEDEHFELIVTS